ncbi:hypothetical protein [Pseudoxanthomonas mexicana]
MKLTQTVVLLSVVMLPLRAEASWFEFCRMEGLVESARSAVDRTPRMFDFKVNVVSAQVDKDAVSESYTDCFEYIGRNVEVTLRLPRKHGQPKVGDRIVITRSVVDGFDLKTLRDVTHVKTELVSYGVATGD